jgi:DNA invertase Pin-like site-specific DNA recombinase
MGRTIVTIDQVKLTYQPARYDDRFWPDSDKANGSAHVRYSGQSRLELDACRSMASISRHPLHTVSAAAALVFCQFSLFSFLKKAGQDEVQVMAVKGKLVEAVAYIRTSSAANVGADKDSDKRQRAAIQAFAKAAGYEVLAEFYDAAVSGADAIDRRKGFAEMLDRIASNGVRTILVESPDRFARDLAVQLAGHDHLKGLGVALIPTSAPDYFLEDTPTAVLVRQVLGAIAQFEKASLVAKLKASRDRKRKAAGKCEGRKSWAERKPELVQQAKRLRRKSPKGVQRSLREIAAELAKLGFKNERGVQFSASSVASILTG